MEVKNMQEQMNEVNRKLDLLMEFVEQQNRKREEFDDLVEDVSIVAKDAFRQSVVLLDKSQVDLEACDISALIIKILRNLDSFHEMLDMMESARDFMKDVTPILHQVGLDAVNKMNELDKKGYFHYISALISLIDKWIQVYPVEDLQRMENNMVNLAGIIRNLSDPELIANINKATNVLATVKMDDQTDNKSLWQIFLMMRSSEVRKSVSYSLRILKELQQER